jgi:hypothetical protein
MECSDRCPIYDEMISVFECPFAKPKNGEYGGLIDDKCLYPAVHKFQMERMGCDEVPKFEVGPLAKEDVEWIVNDIAELGVKIGN